MATEETVSYTDLISAAEGELHDRASLAIQQRARIAVRDRRITELEAENAKLRQDLAAAAASPHTPPAS